jgi:dynein intermediate chain, cytosolic
VQKTRLSGATSGGHAHPVYSIDIVGTQNANNIISCSTDGVVCAWSVDMLAQPQEYLELTNPHPVKTDEVSPTCAGFPPSDPTSFLIGTEEGTMYPCHRYDRAGARAGVDQDLRYKGHTAPVMSLNFHSARGPVDLSDLVLTSSLDWTVKLWKVRPFGSSRATGTSNGKFNVDDIITENISCVTEFPREDVVYDARWAPQRPGVFSLVDGAGNVEVWDLLVDTEIPVAKATPSSQRNAAFTGGYGLRSLNKVAWDEKDGKRLAVGGAAGVVTAFEVGNELAGEGVKGEDWANMKRLVSKMERGVR